MRCFSRVLGFAALLVAYGLAAQEPSLARLEAMAKRGGELHVRALQAYQAEQARGGKRLCPEAQSTIDINSCYAEQLSLAEGNENALVRALGAIFRIGTEASGTPPIRLNFDKAEASWHGYREQACNAAAESYEGGSMQPAIRMGCQITITHHHVEELWAIYSDEGTH